MSFKNINKIHLANAKKIENDKVNMYVVDHFLDDNSCNKLIELIKQNNQRSTITTEGIEKDKYYRTSKSSFFNDNLDFIKKLNNKIALYLGMEFERAETMQGQYYEVGNEFKYHTDYFEYNTPCWENHGKSMGQRTWTFMIYLNNTEEGGSTHFKHLDLRLYPRKGMAVIWNNTFDDGKCNPDTLHCGSPIIKGEKFIITKWFREKGTLSIPYKIPVSNQIPHLTKTGFLKSKLPDVLYKKLIDIYNSTKNTAITEKVDDIYYFNKNNTTITKLLSLDQKYRKCLEYVLQKQLQEWTHLKLEHVTTYGIRIYQDQSYLKLHTDTYTTHIISAIVNIAQDVREEWPLIIYDHYGNEHKIYMKPGDVVLYESAKCWHGRPIPLEGNEYANIFLHFKPLNWYKINNKLEKLHNENALAPVKPIEYV